MVKAVIFDCFGVLTTDYWKEFVATLTAEQIEPARSIIYRYDAGKIDRADFLKSVKKLTGRTPREVEKLKPGEMTKNIELLDYIRKLKKTYKIGLLSNIGSNWIRKSFLSESEQAIFEQMVLSFEVGMAKPDPEIFELTAKRIGVDISQCVLVDDSEGHCWAAIKTGMQAINYKNFVQLEGDLTDLLAA
jgi:HAD superfamily hydrolase (TIGR01509 family)